MKPKEPGKPYPERMLRRRRGKKIGAPPKRDPLPGERFTIATRVRPELKRRLDAAAEESGRSQAQETELRLERSFDRTDLLTEVLTLAYGEEIAVDLMRLGAEMKARAERAGTPFELGLAVMGAAGTLMDVHDKYGGDHPSAQAIMEISAALELWLKDFLVPDWRRAGEEMQNWRDKDRAVTARAEEVEAKKAVRERMQATVIDFAKHVHRRSA
jgi:hypothetical protein